LSFTVGTSQERSQGISTSAPTTRVIDVVELLAEPGNERLRFSDVVGKLGLNQATTHAILTTLCDRGWASRDPVDKTFSLGPAFAAVSAQLDTARPSAHTARAAALRLAAEFSYAASVVERFGDSLVSPPSKIQPGSPAAHPVNRFATPLHSELHSPPGTPMSNSGSGLRAARQRIPR
jgi:IclR helix-turn-helix domain